MCVCVCVPFCAIAKPLSNMIYIQLHIICVGCRAYRERVTFGLCGVTVGTNMVLADNRFSMVCNHGVDCVVSVVSE